jgi:hypothetical protein
MKVNVMNNIRIIYVVIMLFLILFVFLVWLIKDIVNIISKMELLFGDLKGKFRNFY